MSPADDVIFALIARFVVDDIDQLSVSDEKFLRHQLIELKNLVKDVPEQEKQQVIMSWIEKHAEQYRDEWRRKAITQLLLKRRCTDCPLIADDSDGFCIIHHKWSDLLKDYVAGDLKSEAYIKESLELLEKYKTRLKISRITARL